MRSQVIARIRAFLDDNDFVEVETPMLQAAASGAAARPFSTHHNALDRDFYLRISPETYLKRVVAGGFDRVYELGRNFRNEGIDSSHLQEFTMLEWYAAYWDYRDTMDRIERLVERVATEVLGTTVVTFRGHEIELSGPWRRLRFTDSLEQLRALDARRRRAQSLAG